MKTITQRFTYTVCAILAVCSLMAFKAYHNENSKNYIEKIYTQTDRSFYFPGETIWFKSYVVLEDNSVSNISDIVNAQLISPKGAVIKTLKLAMKDGYVYGNFHVNDDWLGGQYTLKVFTNWMRNFGDDHLFTKKLTIQKIVNPNLLLKLKFEKEGYGINSEVFANFEVKDLKNQPLSNHEIAYVVSIKGEKIISKTILTDASGKATPNFLLPKDLNSTDVTLNILIPYNGTTESISRSVPVTLDNLDLQFFPESGKIIAGTQNTVAFKAIDEFGKPVDVAGHILNADGQIITEFSSFHDGMGCVSLHAETGENYVAKLKSPFVSERQIKLPKVYKNGTKFSVKIHKSEAEVMVHSTEKKPLVLEVTSASKVLLQKKISTKHRSFRMDTESFPMGITKFSIKNTSGHIEAERLVFVNAHKQLYINIDIDKSTYQAREKVRLAITTKDSTGKPLPSNLSIAVADNKLVSFADDQQDHILSYLLMSSELKGNIHKPGYYFNPTKAKSYEAIDYVMLTHGWRDYQHKSFDNAQYMPDHHAIQTGTIVDKKGNPMFARLLLLDNHGNQVLLFETEPDGSFAFKFKEKTSLVLLAFRDDGKPVFIKKTDLINASYESDNMLIEQESKEIPRTFDRFQKPTDKTIKKKARVAVSMNEDTNSLDEVIIEAYSLSNSASKTTASVTTISAESIENRPYASVAQTLQGQIAGLQITSGSGQPGANTTVLLRGSGSMSGHNEPLFVVDGVPVNQNIIGRLSASEIKQITIIKDASATALYGCRAANGVVVISTNTEGYINNYGKKKLNSKRFNNYAIQHFYHSKNRHLDKPKAFYMPLYEGENLPEERTDFRQTIYWNPVVQTDENGKAELEFYNSDAITSFNIRVEGVSYNGMVGRQELNYATKKALHIDLKTPNYMALDDLVTLPLRITNETDTAIEAVVELKLPSYLTLVKPFNTHVSIESNSSIIKNIQVKPIEKVKKTTIDLKVQSKEFSDVTSKEVTIISPYFPTETSVSGTKSQGFEFDINHMVEGSLTADFNIYKDVIGDVMHGVESLIRQPSGCFEQTSSTTYPNIMVLKYLRESGNSNPEIEAKALAFIEQGYKRLTGFETKQGGFEWFGNTPPHETLTAYGVLEFTEMKEVYNGVDQAMIDRTVDWLMSRKDGKGGFKKSKKGYDSFASSPQDIANIYIVYALSEANIDVDYRLEYQMALEDALKSEDAYKKAIMLLTSDNLNKSNHVDQLLNDLKSMISDKGFEGLPVENTITRSYGNAKNIETTAFTLLALMREPHYNETLISKGIDFLLKQRKNNRFGSTQSTAMALKALITYTKHHKKKIINDADHITLVINGKSLKKNLNVDSNGTISIENIASYFKTGKQQVLVNYSNETVSLPYCLTLRWDSTLPDSSSENPITMQSTITDKAYHVGDNISMSIDISNEQANPTGMVTAVVGIPSGTTVQPWQLKELLEEEKIAYYEVFDNYVVFYWRTFSPQELKTLRLDLKADIAGEYQAPASSVYLYYGDEHKTWTQGNTVKIMN